MRFGVTAIDSLITIGKGQHIGNFAGSGVGKSTVLGMIVKNIEHFRGRGYDVLLMMDSLFQMRNKAVNAYNE